MTGRAAPSHPAIGTGGDVAGLKRRAYLVYFGVTAVAMLVLAAVLPLLQASTAGVMRAIVPAALVYAGACFVAVWRRPAWLRVVEVAQYAACYPLFLGLMAMLLGDATSEAGAHAALAAVAVWIPTAICWSFIVFGSRGGPLGSLAFVAAVGAVLAGHLAAGGPMGTSAVMFVVQAVFGSSVFIVLLFALSFLLERQTASRITAEVAAEYAIKDVLTRVYTRFALGVRFEQALALARRTDRRLAVALLDVDDFKRVNDDLGHAAGDEVLRELASRVTAAVRDADTVARLGGDEFVVLAFVDDADHAREFGTRLVAVGDEPIGANGLETVVGITVGISVFPDDAESADGLLAAADAAMYAAKAKGKRQAALASQAVSEPLGPRAGAGRG